MKILFAFRSLCDTWQRTLDISLHFTQLQLSITESYDSRLPSKRWGWGWGWRRVQSECRKGSRSEESWWPISEIRGNMISPPISKSQCQSQSQCLSRKFKAVGRNYWNELVQGDSQDGGSATWVSRIHLNESNKPVRDLLHVLRNDPSSLNNWSRRRDRRRICLFSQTRNRDFDGD